MGEPGCVCRVPGVAALVFRFDAGKDFQFVEKYTWIPSIGATYHIGIDGFGLLLVMLTTVVGFLAILSSWNAAQDRTKEYYAFFCCSRRACWASSWRSIFCCSSSSGKPCWCPCTSSSGGWGGPRKVYAAIKFMILHPVRLGVMLLGILTLTTDYQQFQVYSFGSPT